MTEPDIDDREAVKKEAAARGIHLTWFPVQEKWAACTSLDSGRPYRELGGFHSYIRDALNEAIIKLEEID